MKNRPHIIIRFLVLAIAFLVIEGCSFGVKIKDGATAYDQKQYAVAVKMLEEEYENGGGDGGNARTAFLLGKSYQYLEENDLAIQWMRKAVDLDYGNESLADLAQFYKKQGDYKSAVKISVSYTHLTLPTTPYV